MSGLYTLVCTALALAGGYLIGSIPFAVVVSRIMGLKDPRTFGSGNPGATNVLRTGNKTAAALTLLGDGVKGWVAVALATWAWEHNWLPSSAVAFTGVAAVLGHIYPIYLRFVGGKGVATAIGVLVGLQPLLALATAATWLIVVIFSRYSSLAAVVAAIFAPFYYILGGKVVWRMDPAYAVAIMVIAAVLLYRHGPNIGRLLAGKEGRIGQKKK